MLIACTIGIPSALLLLMWWSEVRQERKRAELFKEYLELRRRWFELQDRK